MLVKGCVVQLPSSSPALSKFTDHQGLVCPQLPHLLRVLAAHYCCIHAEALQPAHEVWWLAHVALHGGPASETCFLLSTSMLSLSSSAISTNLPLSILHTSVAGTTGSVLLSTKGRLSGLTSSSWVLVLSLESPLLRLPSLWSLDLPQTMAARAPSQPLGLQFHPSNPLHLTERHANKTINLCTSA